MEKLSLFFLLFMWLAPRCHSDINFSLDSDDDGFGIDITYSDDGSRVQLLPFLLQIYETDGDLKEDDTYVSIQNAYDAFLLSELNAVYSPQHALDEVNSTIFSEKKVELDESLYRFIPEELKRGPTRRDLIEWEGNRGSIENLEDELKFLRGKRTLESRIGSELSMKVNITFDSTPTPSEDEINEKVKEIMQNLTAFVTNLKATEDEELENVYMARRLEIPIPTTQPVTTPPVEFSTETPAIPLPAKPADGSQSLQTVDHDENNGKGNVLIISLVIGIGSTVLLALSALFMMRRRKNDDDSEREVLEVLEESSQRSGISPGFDTRSVNSDSIFSGLTDILTDTGSPKVRATKSISSATTVKANNKKHGFKSPSSIGFKSPSSMAATSTLFAFSEEDEDALSESSKCVDDERIPLSPNGNGPSSCDVSSSALLSKRRESDSNSQKYNVSQDDTCPGKKAKSSVGLFPDKVCIDEKNLDNLSTGPDTAVLVGGAVAAAAATTPQNEKEGYNTVKSASPKSAKSIAGINGAFPTDMPIGEVKEDEESEYKKTMHPLDWSYKSDREDGESLSSNEKGYLDRYIFAQEDAQQDTPKTPLFSPQSQSTRMSSLSGNTTPGSRDSKDTDVSPSHQLINDLVWLEKKIADVRSSAGAPVEDPLCPTSPSSPGMIHASDSLSYKSQDAQLSPSSSDADTSIGSNGIMQNIICRDCFAPPGKLQIVIHSTKDGPAVHTVKPGSSLEGHIFPGDLIIAVDNVDTRTYSAELVMKTMASKSDFERKITVLHFEN
eukprot:CAMPEP_0194248588 /NCGR_PEP_ID=MMETSP0158-20130606/18682_1 /TAXON_ID=33649 /ORGANISM="Thalassionema nitzschioides, Strain L26-B" /LENGTH=781 /DNA_ID=CAMNT_0038984925 /DNA_START=18 /DNA_END=2366 /DNA_ORIENTATION=-